MKKAVCGLHKPPFGNSIGDIATKPLSTAKAQLCKPQAFRQAADALFELLDALAGVLAGVGTSTQAPKPRGKSPGWPKGRTRTKRPRYPVIKKGKAQAKKQAPAAEKAPP